MFIRGGTERGPILSDTGTRVLRRHRRSRLGLIVRLTLPNSTSVSEYCTTDISSSGVFVETDEPLPAGLEVTVRIVLPAAGVIVGSRGKIVRSVRPGGRSSRIPGMGIQFVGDGQDGWEFLSKIGPAPRVRA